MAKRSVVLDVVTTVWVLVVLVAIGLFLSADDLSGGLPRDPADDVWAWRTAVIATILFVGGLLGVTLCMLPAVVRNDPPPLRRPSLARKVGRLAASVVGAPTKQAAPTAPPSAVEVPAASPIVDCPHCQARMLWSASAVGKAATCSACYGRFIMPTVGSVPGGR